MDIFENRSDREDSKKDPLYKRIIESVTERWWDVFGYRIKYFFESTRNLIRWLPVIWKDRDWDDHFIFEILKFKLKNQSKYIGEKNRHTRAFLDSKRMLLCTRLIEKVSSEYYLGEYMDYHNSEYNWIPVKENTDLHKLEIDLVSEEFDKYFSKYPSVYKKVTENEIHQKFKLKKYEDESEGNMKERIAINIGVYNHNRARKLLFNIMEENIEGWWD